MTTLTRATIIYKCTSCPLEWMLIKRGYYLYRSESILNNWNSHNSKLPVTRTQSSFASIGSFEKNARNYFLFHIDAMKKYDFCRRFARWWAELEKSLFSSQNFTNILFYFSSLPIVLFGQPMSTRYLAANSHAAKVPALFF